MQKQSESRMTIEYLTFVLEGEVCMLAASEVLEVMKYTPLTHVPLLPQFLPGVINLRGSIVSVIDLRRVLGLKPFEDLQKTWFVIAEIRSGGTLMRVGLWVDRVEDVVLLDPGGIGPPPDVGMKIDVEYLQGAARQGNDLLMLLDIGRVIAFLDEEISRFSKEEPQPV